MLSTLSDVEAARVLLHDLYLCPVPRLPAECKRNAHALSLRNPFCLPSRASDLLSSVTSSREIKAIAAFYLYFTGTLLCIGFFIAPHVLDKARSLIANLPASIDRLISGQFIVTLGHNQGWDYSRALQIRQFFMGHRSNLINYAEGLAESLKAPLLHTWWLIL